MHTVTQLSFITA